MNHKDTDLIAKLCNDLMPCGGVNMCRPALSILAWVLGASLYMGIIAFGFISIRPDLATVFFMPIYMFETLVALVTFVSAAFAAMWYRYPDCLGGRKVIMLASFSSLFFLAWMGYRAFHAQGIIPNFDWHHCLSDGIILGLIPALTLGLILRKGASTHPIRMAIFAAISVSAAGWLTLHFTCMQHNFAHAFTYHLAPFTLMGLGAGLFSRRFFAW